MDVEEASSDDSDMMSIDEDTIGTAEPRIIRESIGSGAFGRVYRVRDRGGRCVAHKIAVTTAARQLEKEFKAMKRLHHERVVKVYEFYVSDTEACLEMEWIPDGSLLDIIRSCGGLHERTVRRFAREALEGLQYLHEEGIIHRDVKPANMLVDSSRGVKLSDFGLSLRAAKNGQGLPMCVGTPAYLAPECAREQQYSTQSDVWAWACSVCEMGSGTTPWAHTDAAKLGARALVRHLASVRHPDHRPHIPSHFSPALRGLLEQCFSYRPRERPSAQQLLEMAYFSNPSDENMETFEALQSRKSMADQTSTVLIDSLSTRGFTASHLVALRAQPVNGTRGEVADSALKPVASISIL